MRRILSIFLVCAAVLSAANIDFETLSMNFEQRVTNEKKQTLKFRGKLWLKQPDLARYDYESPTPKTIAIKNKSVLMIEPDLMQATRFTSDIAVNIMELWRRGKMIDESTREALINDVKVTLKHEGERFDRVYYKDEFDNFVEIIFTAHKRNIAIDDSFFAPKIPNGYDIIRQ
ncbi:MAG: LolA-like outer membrane lipoprotein chaperone [Helicobacteraceae bacterium]|jgi:outer membrane lipoprotein-sorting protein|nr:LolA-like outer membrane lipoprotein chaperone [Helicobacteraceae bacterium]